MRHEKNGQQNPLLFELIASVTLESSLQ